MRMRISVSGSAAAAYSAKAMIPFDCCAVCHDRSVLRRSVALKRRTIDSSLESTLSPTNRESKPLIAPFVTGSTEEKDAVSNPRSSWVLELAKFAANELKIDECSPESRKSMMVVRSDLQSFPDADSSTRKKCGAKSGV